MAAERAMNTMIRTAKKSRPIGEQLLALGVDTATGRQVWEWQDELQAMWLLYDRKQVTSMALNKMRRNLVNRIVSELGLKKGVKDGKA